MGKDINSVIEQLADIDSVSAKVMQDTQNAKSEYASQIKHQKQDFDKNLQSEIEKEIKDLQISLDSQNKKQIARCRIDCDKNIARLDELFAEKSLIWLDEIFDSITKG